MKDKNLTLKTIFFEIENFQNFFYAIKYFSKKNLEWKKIIFTLIFQKYFEKIKNFRKKIKIFYFQNFFYVKKYFSHKI